MQQICPLQVQVTIKYVQSLVLDVLGVSLNTYYVHVRPHFPIQHGLGIGL